MKSLRKIQDINDLCKRAEEDLNKVIIELLYMLPPLDPEARGIGIDLRPNWAKEAENKVHQIRLYISGEKEFKDVDIYNILNKLFEYHKMFKGEDLIRWSQLIVLLEEKLLNE